MYAAGGEFTENIDKAGGEGTAVFAQRAIAIYCRWEQGAACSESYEEKSTGRLTPVDFFMFDGIGAVYWTFSFVS